MLGDSDWQPPTPDPGREAIGWMLVGALVLLVIGWLLWGIAWRSLGVIG